MSAQAPSPVLMIGLDAAEPRLIEQGMADGSLPNLKRLRDLGCYGRLASPADWLAGSPWPTFYTGTTPADHGCYHFTLWRAELMASKRPTPDRFPLRPFWRDIAAAGPRVVALDVPLTFAPEPFNGVEISGWATHDLLVPPAAYPAPIMDWIDQRFGPSPRTDEIYGMTPSREEAMRTRDELVETTRRAADLAAALIERESWRLFLTCLSTTHRGGHKLWGVSNAHAGHGDASSDALGDVYRACDAAVGRLAAAAAGADVRTIVFSLHGMGENTCRVELLPTMLERILAGKRQSAGRAGKTGLLKRLRQAIPIEWRHEVKRRLPLALQDRLTAFWRLGGVDWSSTQAFGLIADLQGYIRINLRGREAAGIVEPGAAYDRLCEEIAEGLRTFVDLDTGEPVVRDIIRSDRLYAEGDRRDDLPDLLVRWAGSPAAKHRAIVSERYGSIAWPTPGGNPDGRSGNHRPEGFLIAAGPGIAAGGRIEGGHILDLAPTVCALLGVPTPAPMRGKALLGSS